MNYFANKISEQLKSLPWYNRIAISNKAINFIIAINWLMIILGLVTMICGICLNNLNNQQKLILTIFGVVWAFIFMMMFYIFQYVRTKTSINVAKLINFYTILNDYLLENKLINSPIIHSDNNKFLYDAIHAKFAQMVSNNNNLNKKYGIYELLSQLSIDFSYFELIHVGYKKFDVDHEIQILFSTSFNSSFDFIISPHDLFILGNYGYNHKQANDEFDYYYQTENDLNIINKIIEQYQTIIKELNLTIVVGDGMIMVFGIKDAMYLLLDISNYKFYKNSYLKLAKNLDTDVQNFIDIYDFMHKLVCDLHKLKQ